MMLCTVWCWADTDWHIVTCWSGFFLFLSYITFAWITFMTIIVHHDASLLLLLSLLLLTALRPQRSCGTWIWARDRSRCLSGTGKTLAAGCVRFGRSWGAGWAPSQERPVDPEDCILQTAHSPHRNCNSKQTAWVPQLTNIYSRTTQWQRKNNPLFTCTHFSLLGNLNWTQSLPTWQHGVWGRNTRNKLRI